MGAIRLLVVDDQAPFRRAARLVLSLEPGIEIVGEAASGPEAIEFVGRTAVDAVLMDINMPGMSGIEAAARLREAHPGLSVVLCSTEHFGHDQLDEDVTFIPKDELDGETVLRCLRPASAETAD